jgi:hypothetical protein
MTILYILGGVAVIGLAWMFYDAVTAPTEDELWGRGPREDVYRNEKIKRNKETKP